jgi:alkanesulfonate monooxygenase SsuD/methylene tetrahydromethanopterin reductase-like flavin-dependent oxidoreductase (luciferase family)
MTKMNGHTYDTPLKNRILNLLAQVTDEQAHEAAKLAQGDDHEFERHLISMVQAQNNANAAMLQRRDELERTLNTVVLTAEQVEAITEELAEIYAHVGRNPDDEDETADDVADYRRAEKHGVGL